MPESSARILVIDDNLIMRRLVRATLEPEGYTVCEAGTGQAALGGLASSEVDLILQDMLLPDIDGLQLVHRLRELLQNRPVPIIAVSGFAERIHQARTLQAGFDDFLFKPVSPAHLVNTVREHLQATVPVAVAGDRHDIVLADDDPVQRRLLEIQLKHAGFDVATAEDGLAALELARRHIPDLIVSDVLMPRMDGFKLCLAVRADARLSSVPVLLTSSAYVESADRDLALRAGANELMVRTPKPDDLIQAVERCLASGPPQTAPSPEHELPIADYTQRLVQQLERQAGLNARLTERLSVLEAQSAVLAELQNVLQQESGPRSLVDDIAARGLYAFGCSQAAVFLLEPDGRLRLAVQAGYSQKTARQLSALCEDRTLVERLAEAVEPITVPGSHLAQDDSDRLLTASGAGQLLLTPLISATESLGFFLLPLDELRVAADWSAFARTVGASVGQAIRLARSLEDSARSEARYRTIVNTANEAISVVDRQGRITFVNPRHEALFGYTAEEVLGRRFSEFIDQSEHPRAARAFANVLRGVSGSYEVRGARKDGSTVWLIASVAPTLNEQAEFQGAVAMLTDVTARKQAEDELRELSRDQDARVQERTKELLLATERSEAGRATLAAVMTNMTDGLVVVDQGGRVRYCNLRAGELLGVNPAESIGQPIDLVATRLRQDLAGRRSLPSAWNSGLARPAEGASFELSLTGPRREVQFQFFSAANAYDKSLSAGLILRDITVERDLARTKDELVSVVSHELRTPLASVVGFTELLLDEEHPRDEQRLYLRTIGDEGRRLTALINDFLDLERIGSGRLEFKKSAVQVVDVVKQSLAAAGHDAMHPTLLDLPESLPPVWADADAVHQVLTNLIANARKYSPAGGAVRIAGREDGRMVELSVSDHGLGLPAGAMPRLFSAFYRVDDPDRRSIQGTGLGLAICRKIVDGHRGRIWAESGGRGQGSRFVFTLPRVEAPHQHGTAGQMLAVARAAHCCAGGSRGFGDGRSGGPGGQAAQRRGAAPEDIEP